jgi:hypothetical protein
MEMVYGIYIVFFNMFNCKSEVQCFPNPILETIIIPKSKFYLNNEEVGNRIQSLGHSRQFLHDLVNSSIHSTMPANTTKRDERVNHRDEVPIYFIIR